MRSIPSSNNARPLSLPSKALWSWNAQDLVEAAPAEEEVEEEEIVDPKPEIEDSCKPRCVKQLLSYEACVKRVDKDSNEGHKHCTGQYFDYWGCIDQCAAPKIFQKLA